MEEIKEIDEIHFGVYSPDEIRNMAVCKVTSSKLCCSDKNSSYGTVYDVRMGVIENGMNCATCHGTVWNCPGHFGYIEFNEPILHPLYFKQIVSFLRCFCLKCYKLLITKEQVILNNYHKSKGVKRFNKILEKLEKNDMCIHCSYPQPNIKFSTADSNVYMIYKDKEHGKVSIPLQVMEIKKIFDNISDEDVKLLGFNPEMMHPRNLIFSAFPVIPTACRPYIITEGNMCDDDLTIQLVEIIKANNHLEQKKDGTQLTDTKKQKFLQTLKFRVATFFNNSSSKARHTTNGRVIKCIKKRLTGKEGLIRMNLMGKVR